MREQSRDDFRWNNAEFFALTPDISKLTTFALPGIQPELLGGTGGTLTELTSDGSLSGLGSNTPAALRVIDEDLANSTPLAALSLAPIVAVLLIHYAAQMSFRYPFMC